MLQSCTVNFTNSWTISKQCPTEVFRYFADYICFRDPVGAFSLSFPASAAFLKVQRPSDVNTKLIKIRRHIGPRRLLSPGYPRYKRLKNFNIELREVIFGCCVTNTYDDDTMSPDVDM